MRKRPFLFLFIFLFAFVVSCGPRPAYKTAQGKKKMKKYNALQFDREDYMAPKGKKPKKRKKNW